MPNYIFTICLFKTVVCIYSLWFLGRHKQSLSDAVLSLKQQQKFIKNIKIHKQSCIGPWAICYLPSEQNGSSRTCDGGSGKRNPTSASGHVVPATHPAGFRHPLSSDVQAQPASIYFIFGYIYTLCNE